MKKVTDDVFRRYDLRDSREKQAADEAGLSRLAQSQIGRRLGTQLWSPEQEIPDAFQQALQKIKQSLS
jgi:hypothetical protein